MNGKNCEYLKLSLLPLLALPIALLGTLHQIFYLFAIICAFLIMAITRRRREELVRCKVCGRRLDTLPGGWRVPFLLNKCQCGNE